jgi:hypothetical protein
MIQRQSKSNQVTESVLSFHDCDGQSEAGFQTPLVIVTGRAEGREAKKLTDIQSKAESFLWLNFILIHGFHWPSEIDAGRRCAS